MFFESQANPSLSKSLAGTRFNMSLRDAWTALDQARTKAWRHWRTSFRGYKSRGLSFEDAKALAWWDLYKELRPFYDAVEAAQNAAQVSSLDAT